LKVNTVRWTAKQSEEAHIECHGVTPGVWLKAIGSQVGAFPVCHVLGGKIIKMKKKERIDTFFFELCIIPLRTPS
jgi:hypothetical protein